MDLPNVNKVPSEKKFGSIDEVLYVVLFEENLTTLIEKVGVQGFRVTFLIQDQQSLIQSPQGL